MKRNKFLAGVGAFAMMTLGVGWRVAAQQVRPAAKDALAEWQYPGAKIWGQANRQQEKAPLQCLRCTSKDSIADVFLYYQKKRDPRFVANEANGWQDEQEQAMLTTQFGNGFSTQASLPKKREMANVALMVIHQPRQTITIQLSRDAADKGETEIVLVSDAR